jgi:hypothetical protein
MYFKPQVGIPYSPPDQVHVKERGLHKTFPGTPGHPFQVRFFHTPHLILAHIHHEDFRQDPSMRSSMGPAKTSSHASTKSSTQLTFKKRQVIVEDMFGGVNRQATPGDISRRFMISMTALSFTNPSRKTSAARLPPAVNSLINRSNVTRTPAGS